jgi:hypothetical protein
MEEMAMANICMNYIDITGDPLLIKTFADNYLVKKNEDEYDINFNEISPCPEGENEYNWAINHWGNKWDGRGSEIFIEDDAIYLVIDTAWGPCDQITYKLIELCPGLSFVHKYHEGGMGFCGVIEHYAGQDSDEYFESYYDSSTDPQKYWEVCFQEEYETLDWLYEHIEDQFTYEEISEDVRDGGLKLLDDSEDIDVIVSYCLENDIL